MADALTSGLKTYGEVRTKIGVVVAVIVSIIFYIIGAVILIRKPKYTSQTTGILSNISCSSNTCSGMATYDPTGAPSPSPSSYTFSSNWPVGSKDGQTVAVFYDPSNPTDAGQGPPPKMVGWVLIGVATIILIFSFLFLKFFSSLSNQGKALVGGFQAAGNISSFFRRN